MLPEKIVPLESSRAWTRKEKNDHNGQPEISLGYCKPNRRTSFFIKDILAQDFRSEERPGSINNISSVDLVARDPRIPQSCSVGLSYSKASSNSTTRDSAYDSTLFPHASSEKKSTVNFLQRSNWNTNVICISCARFNCVCLSRSMTQHNRGVACKHALQESGEKGVIFRIDCQLQADPLVCPKFAWLDCTRYRPPKVPRIKRRRSPSARSSRQPRIPFTPYQQSTLEKHFCVNRYLTAQAASELASILTLPKQRIKIWYQNRRARARREETQRDDDTMCIS